VLVLLFAKGPIEQMVMALPALSQAQVSFRRILAIAFDEEGEGTARPAAFETIALENVSYRFPETSFALGPVDLQVARGETLFVVGENGSGKTTLIKLLLGLYAPHEGRVLLDGRPVDADGYRQLFSAVFSDYYLFDDLPANDCDASARAWLERLRIARKVDVANGLFTTTELSTGERKRLALVRALLEDRPILMFDEWPADQDPSFRRFFYGELISELKRRGKTLIVVSHDDRYFAAADRIVRLDEGRLSEETLPTVRAAFPGW